MTRSPDIQKVLIVGQGLGGTLLGWQLQKKGVAIKVVQSFPRRTASLVSAGMVDPISGQRLALAYRVTDTLPLAKGCYQALEYEMGQSLITEYPLWRLFRHPEDVALYQRKEALLAPYVTASLPEWGVGGIVVTGFQVSVAPIIRYFESKWRASGVLIEQNMTWHTLTHTPTGIQWENETADMVIDCSGFGVADGLFSWLPHRLSRGDALACRSEVPMAQRVVNHGYWVRPIQPTAFQFGASYAWQHLHQTEATHYHELATQLHLRYPHAFIERVDSGIRHMLADAKPVLGSHPVYPRVAIMAGVGSKGTQLYPYLVSQCVAWLCDRAVMPVDMALSRYVR